MLKVATRRERTLALRQKPTQYWAAGAARVRRAILLALVMPWFAPSILASEGGNAAGKLEGAAFVGDPDHRSYVAGAKVVASGPVGVPGKFCASEKDKKLACDGPGFSVPVRWLEIGLFLFQPDRG